MMFGQAIMKNSTPQEFCSFSVKLNFLFHFQNSQSPNDLIRLDSTPSFEDFDPLLSSNTSSTSQCNFGPTNINSSNNNVLSKPGTMTKEVGLSNPLYPYCVPQGNNIAHGNPSFLYPTDIISSVSRNLPSLSSVQHSCNSNINQQPKYESQDSELLKEYGLDFKSLSLRNGGLSLSPNGAAMKPIVTDPFEEVERLAKDTQQHQLNASQSLWTKFE